MIKHGFAVVIVRLAVGLGLLTFTVFVAPSGVRAEVATSSKLVLDSSFTGAAGKMATEEPTAIRDCAHMNGGSKKDTDGWVFNQPAIGAPVDAYLIAFIRLVDGTPDPVLVGITKEGLVRVPFNPAVLANGIDDTTELLAVPDGVTGKLLDKGADGAWLRTPQGWRLAYGVLQVGADAGAATSFSLTAVCLPPAVKGIPTPPRPSQSASPSAPGTAASPTVGGNAAAGAPAADSANADVLPVTGDRTGFLVGAGGLFVLVGVVLLVAVRRRPGGAHVGE